jgi:hypothetical protein
VTEAADLEEQARKLQDEADCIRIREALSRGRTLNEAALAEALEAAVEATARAFSAEVQRMEAQSAVSEIQRRLDVAEVVKAGSDLTERIQARSVIYALQDEAAALHEPLTAANEEVRRAAGAAQNADNAVEHARYNLRRVDEAIADPLHHPIAKLTPAYQRRVGRGEWFLVCKNPELYDGLDQKYACEMRDELIEETTLGKIKADEIFDAGRHGQRNRDIQQMRLNEAAREAEQRRQNLEAENRRRPAHRRDIEPLNPERPAGELRPGLVQPGFPAGRTAT